jgi:hypothetical protein
MKVFPTPRCDAADLTLFFRARAIDRMRRAADRTAEIKARLNHDVEPRDRINHADRASEANASFWILHAR